MLSTTVVIIFLVIIIYKYFNINSDYWRKRNIRQENMVLWKFITGKKSLSEIYKEVYDAHPNEPHVGVFLGIKPALILRDIQNIEAVLNNDFSSFYSRGFKLNASDFLGDNLLFFEDYKRWKITRQKLSPLFSTYKMKKLFSVTKRCANDFIDYIEENPEIMENPLKAFFMYTTACISSTIFGIGKETESVLKSSFSDFAYKSMSSTSLFNLKFAVSILSPELFNFLNLKAFSAFEELFVSVIKTEMNNRRNEKGIHHDFIDLCLRLEKEGQIRDCVTGYETDVTIQFLAAQTLVFILGGIDTSASAIAYALLELSNNPDILKKVHAEIDEMFEKNKSEVTFENIDNDLDYLRKVINEAMRKYPPVGSLQRICHKDTILPAGGLKIEKGTIIVIPTYALHRDKKYFPDPDVFDPERFSTENISNIAKYSYMPFGEGKRICIGSKLALMEIIVCLAWFLRKYTLEEQSYEPKNFEPSIFSLRDINLSLKIIRRDHQHS